jgi:hypothetical protein
MQMMAKIVRTGKKVALRPPELRQVRELTKPAKFKASIMASIFAPRTERNQVGHSSGGINMSLLDTILAGCLRSTLRIPSRTEMELTRPLGMGDKDW